MLHMYRYLYYLYVYYVQITYIYMDNKFIMTLLSYVSPTITHLALQSRMH